jgi:hypothetical protein
MILRTNGWAVACAAVAAGAAIMLWQRPAESQVQVAPTFTAVGVASTGAASTAWFHHPATGRVVACQSPSAGAGGVQCVEGRLP